jgi:RsiW-degrading membrane proteinase PrsW (M82 family)
LKENGENKMEYHRMAAFAFGTGLCAALTFYYSRKNESWSTVITSCFLGLTVFMGLETVFVIISEAVYIVEKNFSDSVLLILKQLKS